MEIGDVVMAPIHYTAKIFGDSDAATSAAKMIRAIIERTNPVVSQVASWYDKSMLRDASQIQKLQGKISPQDILEASCSVPMARLYTTVNHVIQFTSAHFWMKQIDKIFSGKALYEKNHMTPFGFASTTIKVARDARDCFEFFDGIDLFGISRSVGRLFGYGSFKELIPDILDHQLGIMSNCLDMAHQIEMVWIYGWNTKGIAAMIKITADVAKSCAVVVIYIEGFQAVAAVKFWCLLYSSSCSLLTHCMT